jgi:hypothetical protein
MTNEEYVANLVEATSAPTTELELAANAVASAIYGMGKFDQLSIRILHGDQTAFKQLPAAAVRDAVAHFTGYPAIKPTYALNRQIGLGRFASVLHCGPRNSRAAAQLIRGESYTIE